MTVRELVELLNAHDPNARVSLMFQPHYPHEHGIGGVVSERTASHMKNITCPSARARHQATSSS